MKSAGRIGKVTLKSGLTIHPLHKDVKSDAHKHLMDSITKHGEIHAFVLVTIDPEGYFTWSFTKPEIPSIPPTLFCDRVKRIVDTIDGPC